jgi:hypothetical protein
MNYPYMKHFITVEVSIIFRENYPLEVLNAILIIVMYLKTTSMLAKQYIKVTSYNFDSFHNLLCGRSIY